MRQLHSVLCLIILGFSLTAEIHGQSTRPGSEDSHYLDGIITVKLKADSPDYQEQSGFVFFNIPSLDDKVQQFEINLLKKRFKINKDLARPDLPDLGRIYELHYGPQHSLRAVIAAFSNDPNVEYAEGIPKTYPSVVPDDALYEDCQHLPQIMAEEAWDIHKGEDGTEEVVIAIVDSGSEWKDEDLVDNLWQNLGEDADNDGVTIEFNGTDWVLDPDDLDGIDNDGNGYEDDLIGFDFWEWTVLGDGSNPDPAPHTTSHGTHCAGIAAGVTNNGIGISSISYNLKYMPVKVNGGFAEFSNTFAGIIYAAENGADIISCSWSRAYSQADQEAVDYAWGLGSIIVATSGNTGEHSVEYPSNYLHVLNVAWVHDNDVKHDNSSYHLSVDVSAPGVGILSTVIGNEYEAWNGASMACPIVSGALGLLKSYQPELTNEELITRLIGSTDNIDLLNPDYAGLLGSGRINAYELLVGDLEDPYLELDLENHAAVDDNGNGVNESGEQVTINLDLRNYMPTYGSTGATFTLSSTDPDISIIDGEALVDIPADAFISLEDEFVIEISADATSHVVELNLHVDADIEVVAGEDLTLAIIINPSGYFVYDGLSVGDFSGQFIYDYLIENGYDAMYSSGLAFPSSFIGLDAVFLSFGNELTGRKPVDEHAVALMTEFIEQGGDVYIEGADMFGWDQPGNEDFHNLFGLESSFDGEEDNPINSLTGFPDAITSNMSFTGSTQEANFYVDTYEPLATATSALEEGGYGNVAVQFDSPTDYQTFCFSYALSKLTDGVSPSTREDLIQRVVDFFEGQWIGMDERNNEKLRIFPNPASDQITVDLVEFVGSLTVRLIAMDGRLVWEERVKGGATRTLDISRLASGMYSVLLQSSTSIAQTKVVIE